jgi:hypothetical protein
VVGTIAHLCACPKPGPGFPTSYVMVFCMFNESRRDVIVRFVDIGDHHCLRFVFIKHLHTLQPAI